MLALLFLRIKKSLIKRINTNFGRFITRYINPNLNIFIIIVYINLLLLFYSLLFILYINFYYQVNPT